MVSRIDGLLFEGDIPVEGTGETVKGSGEREERVG
jgi:hypothetical protein